MAQIAILNKYRNELGRAYRKSTTTAQGTSGATALVCARTHADPTKNAEQ